MAIAVDAEIKQENIGSYLRKQGGGVSNIMAAFKWAATVDGDSDASGGNITVSIDLGARSRKLYYVVTELRLLAPVSGNASPGFAITPSDWDKYWNNQANDYTIYLGGFNCTTIVAGASQAIQMTQEIIGSELKLGRPRKDGTNPGLLKLLMDNVAAMSYSVYVGGYALDKPIPIMDEMPEVK